jgi:hypothetical protein
MINHSHIVIIATLAQQVYSFDNPSHIGYSEYVQSRLHGVYKRTGKNFATGNELGELPKSQSFWICCQLIYNIRVVVGSLRRAL